MNPAAALATVLVEELVRNGLTEAVIAPGSRSAPLALALHARAGAVPPPGPRPVPPVGPLRLHVRIDERSAGYLALGLARAGGRPVAVCCTSGTAAANLHPAVVEAAEAGVPLLVLTADRPPELRGTGANQTIDQIKLYGSAVRWFAEVGVPEAVPGMVGYWRSLACRAWAAARGPDPGPVHLNLAFRDPLVPGPDDPAWPEPLGGRPDGRPWTQTAPPEEVAPAPAPVLPYAARAVLVCGDGDADPAPYVAHAEAAGWPVLAEPTSNARYGRNAVPTYQHLLRVPAFAAAHRPDLVVSIGRPGLSRQLLGYLRTAREHVVVSGTPRWPDPVRTATALRPPGPATAEASTAKASTAKASAAEPSAPEETWLSSWRAADTAARSAVDALLDADDTPSEPRLARDLGRTLPDGALLVAGSSLPIRDLDQQLPARTGLRVIGNRGASGIDGLVSTAVGAALAHAGPAYALLGDLTLIHDQNGLVLGPEEPRPDLAIVVVDNRGGQIFGLLEPARTAAFPRLFATPHPVDFAALARAAGVGWSRLDRMSELAGALAAGTGLRLVEVGVDATAGAALRERMHAAVAAALGHPPG